MAPISLSTSRDLKPCGNKDIGKAPPPPSRPSIESQLHAGRQRGSLLGSYTNFPPSPSSTLFFSKRGEKASPPTFSPQSKPRLSNQRGKSTSVRPSVRPRIQGDPLLYALSLSLLPAFDRSRRRREMHGRGKNPFSLTR